MRHTVAKVVLGSLLVLALVTGVTTTLLYRHLNSNLTLLNIAGQIVGDRPPKKQVDGPQEPLNILVMGSDSRDCKGCNIDNLTGEGQRSDTTILLHLSADRERAYGVSIPRDSVIDRPDCKTTDGTLVPAQDSRMWNEAYSLAGPACTVQQFEHLTKIRVDHFVVVDFEGFRGMVDAIGGVQVCIPETIDDRSHGIYLEAGDRKIKGQEALNYVRERYAVSQGSDIGRMKRQQAFLASMASAVVSSKTLANPLKILGFLNAATKSLTLDDDLNNLADVAKLGYQFRGIGLRRIQFITIPNTTDPDNANRLVWTDDAKKVWRKLKKDNPLTKRLTSGVIKADAVPGEKAGKSGKASNGTGSGSGKRAQARADAGLCA